MDLHIIHFKHKIHVHMCLHACKYPFKSLEKMFMSSSTRMNSFGFMWPATFPWFHVEYQFTFSLFWSLHQIMAFLIAKNSTKRPLQVSRLEVSFLLKSCVKNIVSLTFPKAESHRVNWISGHVKKSKSSLCNT